MTEPLQFFSNGDIVLSGFLELEDIAEPPAPAVGKSLLYKKTGFSSLFYKSDGSSEIEVVNTQGNNVSGPVSTEDKAIPRFQGTSGSILQSSGVIITDTDNMLGLTDLTLSGQIVFDTVTNDLKLNVTNQTTSSANVTIPDLGGINGDIVVTNAVQTLANKNLISPSISNGPILYGALSSNPISPTPTTGSQYFNTVVGEYFYYSNGNNWLSVASYTLDQGVDDEKKGTDPGDFFRMNNEDLSNSTGAFIPFTASLTGIAINRDNTSNNIFVDLRLNGSLLYQLALGTNTNVSATNIEVNMVSGVLSSLNSTTSDNELGYTNITIYYKRRIV